MKPLSLSSQGWFVVARLLAAEINSFPSGVSSYRACLSNRNDLTSPAFLAFRRWCEAELISVPLKAARSETQSMTFFSPNRKSSNLNLFGSEIALSLSETSTTSLTDIASLRIWATVSLPIIPDEERLPIEPASIYQLIQTAVRMTGFCPGKTHI